MIEESELSIVKACKAIAISKPTFYRWKSVGPASQEPILPLIRDIALEFPKYGYRRMTYELRNRGAFANHKRVLRVMRENNLLCRRKKAFKPVTTNSNHGYEIYPNLAMGIEVTGLNQLWVSDITYIHLPREFVYLAAIIDLFSRKCVGWSFSRDIDTQLTLTALNRAISARQNIGFSDLIHHSDQGVQYASDDYVKRLEELGIKISMSRRGNVYDNAFAESFMKTLKSEEVDMNEYETFQDALTNIQRFIEEVYNKKRLHSSIGYVSPEKFEQEVLNSC